MRGTKHFTLLPPTEGHRTCPRTYPAARWQRRGDWELVPEEPERLVEWASVNPLRRPTPEQATFFSKEWPPPLRCTVRAGEMLYLPSMWYHLVEQEEDEDEAGGAAVAVNWWYDMDFGAGVYAAHGLVREVAARARARAAGSG